MEKLEAITGGSGTPEQKLADIDTLVNSFGWRSTPLSVGYLLDDVREAIRREKAALDAQHHSEDDVEGEWAEENGSGGNTPTPNMPQEGKIFSPEDSKELAVLNSYMTMYSIASFCADHEAHFTAEEIDRMRSHISDISSKMSLSATKRDKAWEIVQTILPQVTATMTEYDCALEKQSYAGFFPEAFVSSDAQKNPF